MTDDVEIPYALDPNTNRLVHVRNAPNGLSHFVCCKCREPLIACQGPIRQWYYRHQGDTANCVGGRQTSVHLRAIEILLDAKAIEIPPLVVRNPDGRPAYVAVPGTIVPLTNAQREVTGPGFRADVVAEHAQTGRPLAVEVAFSHFSDAEKISRLKAVDLHAIEIDLANFGRYLVDDPSFVDAVLYRAPRYWLHHPRLADLEANRRRELEAAEQQRQQRLTALARTEQLRQAELLKQREAEAARIAAEHAAAIAEAERQRAARLPAMLQWAQDYYPARLAPAPLVEVSRSDAIALFERCPSRRAHLALVDQAAVRVRLTDPECRAAARQSWKRHSLPQAVSC